MNEMDGRGHACGPARPDAAAAVRHVVAADGVAVAPVYWLGPSGRPAGGRRRRHTQLRADGSPDPIGGRAPIDLPCQVHDPELWFAESPADLERAKALCAECPALNPCLAGAVERREVVGVWGGQIFDHGRIVTHKRPRGRPRNDSTAPRR